MTTTFWAVRKRDAEGLVKMLLERYSIISTVTPKEMFYEVIPAVEPPYQAILDASSFQNKQVVEKKQGFWIEVAYGNKEEAA